MKTAISIPDDLFADAELLARELKKSRSRLRSSGRAVKIDGNEDEPAMTIPAAASLMPGSFGYAGMTIRLVS